MTHKHRPNGLRTQTAERHLTAQPIPEPQKRFAIFKADDAGWVLRDRHADRDYPFWTRAGAIAGMDKRRTRSTEFIGSPISVAAYGSPLENVEEYA